MKLKIMKWFRILLAEWKLFLKSQNMTFLYKMKSSKKMGQMIV